MEIFAKPKHTSTKPIRPFTTLKLAVVIIDMHEPNEKRGSSYPFGQHFAVARRICNLLQTARTMNLPIFLVVYDVFGALDHKIVETAGPNAKLVVKNETDAFTGSSIDAELRAYGVDSIVLAGCSKYCCALATAKSALARGYKIMTSEGLLLGSIEHQPQLLEYIETYLKRTEYYFTLWGLLRALRKTEQNSTY